MPPDHDPDLDQAVPEPMIRIDALRRIGDLCAELGVDLSGLFLRAQLDPAMLGNRHAMVPLRAFANLFERAEADLGYPDFALRLAALQGGEGLFGPLDIAMRHAPTLEVALRYGCDHFRAYSSGIDARLEMADGSEIATLSLAARLPAGPGRTAVELHGLLSFRYLIGRLSDGAVVPVLTKVPVLKNWNIDNINKWFSSPVVAGPVAAIGWQRSDLTRPIAGNDPLILEMARDFVETRYPQPAQVLGARVRANIERLLAGDGCTQQHVASILAMHPRTLQRRLRDEAMSFDGLKDEVRRDLAWRLLTGSELPFVAVARHLGYADASVLSRACMRWFEASPRALRPEKEHRSGG